MPRTLILAMLLSVMVTLTPGCSALTGEKKGSPTPLPAVQDQAGITAEGRLEPIRFVLVAPSTDGLVSEVLVNQGDTVRAGQVLARLDRNQAQSLEAAQARAAVEMGAAYEAVRTAQSELDAYPMPRIFVGMTAEQATRMWLEKVDATRVDFEPYKDSSRKTLKPNRIFPSLPRRIWFDTNEYKRMAREYKKHLDVAWMNYRKAVLWLVLDSRLESAKARLLHAQNEYDAIMDASLSDTTAGVRAMLAAAEIRAPFAGRITNLNLKLGERVNAGDSAATIGDFSNWVVKTTDLTEIDVVSIEAGQPVTITLDAVPGRSFRGQVLTIGQNFSERQGDIVYLATILLADSHPDMRWGMTAQVEFIK